MKRFLVGMVVVLVCGHASVTHDHTFYGFVTGLLALLAFFVAIGVVGHPGHSHGDHAHG